ncbi:MAG: hypothetical protein U0570_16235 [Phycisphaerales bacterium]
MRPNRRKPKNVRRHPARGSAKPAKAVQEAVMSVPVMMEPRETKLLREMLWQNVVREMLTALCIETGQGDADGKPRVLDGRLTLITFRGERIPIGAVRPLINFGVGTTAAEKQLSVMLQGTVFQIVTPDGDVFTLPLHEIRGLHALSESIMQQLQSTAEDAQQATNGVPFGFAAFTSLAHGLKDRPIPQAPDDPSE